ncbi:protein MFI isoform X2 [Hemiscyllium ocellatum]|uniref:protein MFI isoform X2 n=1 Tax=Hemiscyllium ocellatum TaxID=170820 RepID=UPI00296614E9|nr:protein MFI isoform X2 [Hemiscyllium ocellatum]
MVLRVRSIEAHLPDTNNKDEHCLTDSKTLVNESLKFESSVTKEQQKTLAENSARIIQRAWRRHIDTQLFKHYKNMINFRGQGNPRFMMKCINPIEAGLLDSAAGVHVRFRLGGETFPPKIYYKIFTHRPIVDLCANSPKDYTHPAAKQKPPRQIHNRNSVKKQEDDHNGWYKRLENNDWRSLSDKYLGTTVDYMEFEPNRKRTTFHHCTLQRKQDAKRKQKQKKIEWMKKMYQDGILQAQTLNPNTAVLVQRATEGLIDSVEQKGPNSILDWEVDELLEWTNALNFEKYLNDWTEIACSSSSANLPGSRSHFVENDLYKQVRLCVMNTYAAMQDAAQYTI